VVVRSFRSELPEPVTVIEAPDYALGFPMAVDAEVVGILIVL